MISNDLRAYLLFIEPTQAASAIPLLDELTRKMAAALRAAPPSADSWLGMHDCICGATSMSHDYILPDGRRTNSLCVHYLAHHRAEVPNEQLREVARLNCGELDPTEWELTGNRYVRWDELDSERQEALLKRALPPTTEPQRQAANASTATFTNQRSEDDLMKPVGREDWLSIVQRWFAGAVLCFFAVAPAWVGGHLLFQAIEKPQEWDLLPLAILAVCGGLTYFLLLLSYRAFSGRGRKQDGGLLPPWAMKGFVHAFGVVAVCIIAIGIYQRELRPIVGGAAYLLVAYVALYGYGRRSRA